ncbi:unnamed protein product [Caenorhabditis angaria]|uniref:Uncharacterized protein n=1 Tax=Caenorhabditis angaria TaxID=860376 RepID=A0A9P1IWC5_9PELO|nr:unnamed protein product [Caenorhabditis angaria]
MPRPFLSLTRLCTWYSWTTTQVDSSRLGVDKTAVFDSTNDSSRLVEKVSRLENDSSRVEWFFSTRLDSDGQFSHGVGLDGEYWMVIGGHGDSAPITPTAPIMGILDHWWNLLNWWMVELANGAIRQLV